jgi:hypothetical protein
MRYSKGICWLDDTRIPFVDSDKETINFDRPRLREKNEDWILTGGFTFDNNDVKEYNQQGRFTPNLLVCDDMLNDGVISKSGGRTISKTEDTNIKNNVYNVGWVRTGSDVKDSGSSSRYYDLDKWFDKVIDEIQ